MTAASPASLSIQHVRRTGRLTNEARETRTPQGRGLQAVESVVMTISGHTLSYRSGAEIRVLHDAAADAKVREVEAIADLMIASGDPVLVEYGHAIKRQCQDYWHHDGMEDSVALHGDGLVDAIHRLARKLGGWIERAAVMLRGGR